MAQKSSGLREKHDHRQNQSTKKKGFISSVGDNFIIGALSSLTDTYRHPCQNSKVKPEMLLQNL